jgi:hypothetical protein
LAGGDFLLALDLEAVLLLERNLGFFAIKPSKGSGAVHGAADKKGVRTLAAVCLCRGLRKAQQVVVPGVHAICLRSNLLACDLLPN